LGLQKILLHLDLQHLLRLMLQRKAQHEPLLLQSMLRGK
jgi:hypothetical protein